MKFALYSDLHYRSTVPEARLDDYLSNQDKLITWLSEEFKDYIHIVGGDVTHYPRERSEPLTFAIELAKKVPVMYGVWGNHDLLYHSMELRHKTTLGALETIGKFKSLSEEPTVFAETADFGPVYVYGYHYGDEIKHITRPRKGTTIAVYHGMVLQGPDPFVSGHQAVDLLSEYPEYDIILTGDNHKQFVVTDGERVLINPGSLKRDNADQVDHRPMVFTFDAETNIMDRIPVPVDDDILDRAHLDAVVQRNERLEKLADRFKEAKEITLDFYDNVLSYLKENDVEDGAELRVLEWIS